MPPTTHVLEIPVRGNCHIRPLTTLERSSLRAMDLEQFNYWKYRGGRRFWAIQYTGEQLRRHGATFSKSYGFHDVGNDTFEEYEEGFERADAILNQFGTFSYFWPEYSTGSEAGQVLPPTVDLRTLIPSCFVDAIERKELMTPTVTSDLGGFLEPYAEYLGGYRADEAKLEAVRMGLL